MMGAGLAVRAVGVRRWWWMAAVAVVVAVTAVVWLRPSTPPDQPRARPYLDVSACLLTDERGVSGPEAAGVWAGMQDASLATRVRVQHLAVSGEQSVDNAAPFVASLAQGGCDLVLAAGEVPVAAVGPMAGRFPSVRFVTVGGGATAGNVTVLENSGDVRSAVGRKVAAVAGS